MKDLKNVCLTFLKGAMVLFFLFTTLLLGSMILESCNKQEHYTKTPNKNVEEHLIAFKAAMKKANDKLKKTQTTVRSVEPTDEEPAPPIDPVDPPEKEALALEYVAELESSALNLIKSYGVTEAEIISEFGSLDPGKITLAAQSILATEDMIDNQQTLSIFDEEDYSLVALQMLGVNSANAQAQDTFGGCVADALGVYAVAEITEKGIKGLGKKGVLKIIRKVAGKALGPIGVALAVYDFADCMDWL